VGSIEFALFQKVRKFSRLAVAVAILASLIFAQVIESSDNTWQVVIAVIALAVGIPHGALDHLVTLPKSSAIKMAGFIAVYVAVAIIAVMALLTWNVAGFIFVVAMSAVHFGIGDAAFVSEIDRRSVDRKPFQKYLYATAAGTLPVVIPLVNEKSNSALEKVNPALLDWHQGLNNDLMLWTMVLTAVVLLRLVQKRRDGEAIDLVLLYLLAVTAPPLVAFAVYFGCWHALRHTARLTLTLPSSQAAFAEGDLKRAFVKAVLPGTPALIGTFVVAAAIVIFRGDSLDDQFLWVSLVVVWALTVPHMAVTARLDRKALS
jgi:Brp/Blh family beta-carotene 15,15'-monooxygenase